ncbi:MAG: hypothetical protein HFE30_01500 [Clostridiales bacterium]|nr:hypothetical protein [Clostridiales bacterium]
MKKIISLVASAAMIFGIFSLTGCEQSRKSPKEMFELGTKQLFSSAMFDKNDVDFTSFDTAKLNLNDLAMSVGGEQAFDSSDIMPISLELTAKKTGGDSFALLGGLSVAGEKISALINKTGNNVYASFPEVSDIFFSGNLDEILKESEIDAAEIADVAEVLKNNFEKLVADDNFTRESADETIMDKKYTSLDKIKYTLTSDMISDFISDINDGISAAAGEASDEISDIPEISAEMSYYFDKEDLKRANLLFTVDDYMIGADSCIERNKTDLETEVTYTVQRNGEVLLTAEGSTHNSEKNGKIEGGSEITYKSEVSETSASDNDYSHAYGFDYSDDYFASLDGQKISVEYTGERDGNTVNLDYEYSYGMSGITMTIPMSVKIETGDSLFRMTYDIDTKITMLDVKMNFDLELSRSENIVIPSYDEKNAVEIKDIQNDAAENENLQKFLEDVEKFFEESELASIFNDMIASNSYSYYGEDDMYYDDGDGYGFDDYYPDYNLDDYNLDSPTHAA